MTPPDRERSAMPDDAVNRWAEALARHRGRDYWRGLDELLKTPEFAAAVRREFPAGADQLEAGGMSRRGFLQLLGASLALAGVTGCVKRPREPILPYVRQPAGVTPGVPLHYATAMTLGGYGTGLLVESHAGRPTKIEGNPDHPASLGSAGVFEQASLLQLYDPHRARRIRWKGRPRDLGCAGRRARAGTAGTAGRGARRRTASPARAEYFAAPR